MVELQGDNPRPMVINMFSSTVCGTGDQNRLVTREVKLLENAKAVGVSVKLGIIGRTGGAVCVAFW